MTEDTQEPTGDAALSCPSCGAELSLPVLYDSGGVCPSCSAELVLGDEDVSLPEPTQEEADLDALEGLDLEFARKIASLPREGIWQARVVAAMLQHYCAEFRASMAELPPISTSHGLFSRSKHVKEEIDDAVEGFMMALVGCEDVLRKELGMAMGASDLTGARIFYDQFGDELHQLERFHAKGAAIAMPNDAMCRDLQNVMLGWGSYIAEQLELLAYELTSVADREAEELWQSSPQISLAPVTLTRFYELYERLK